ncbi:hypothetical protein M422DRAFT_275183 [Sphaerobolus stellatus SS14]|uniref:Uncharacterized protein n=1 Tax=Sphaerobolus stellatus (strain SS14) TaxID=990650 RepID=A0A0C9UFW7_SPHS4|nr:hypothetical protein M422DRAFT_275183 [Sphaerobolus stellatus SS14]
MGWQLKLTDGTWRTHRHPHVSIGLDPPPFLHAPFYSLGLPLNLPPLIRHPTRSTLKTMKFSLTILSFASIVAVAAQSAANSTASDSAAASSSNSTAADTTSSDSTSSTGSSGSSFAVPSGISSSCSSFLQSLDTESAIQSCVSPALVALEDSNPTLASVCASTASSTCSESDYYQALSNFSSSCVDELITSPNANVTAIYDSLYVALPFQKAVCTQDNLNNWCAQGNATNTDVSGASANSAQSPLSTSEGYPDAEAFASDDILFLGYNANMDASSLCTTCLQKVLTIYFGHESKRPYPSGLSG